MKTRISIIQNSSILEIFKEKSWPRIDEVEILVKSFTVKVSYIHQANAGFSFTRDKMQHTQITPDISYIKKNYIKKMSKKEQCKIIPILENMFL